MTPHPAMIERAIEAERTLLASVLLCPGAFDESRPLVQAEYFFLPQHGQLWRAIEIADEGAVVHEDPLAVYYSVVAIGAEETWTRIAIGELLECCGDSANAVYHAREVRSQYFYRERLRLISEADKDMAATRDHQDADLVCVGLASRLQDLSEQREGVEAHTTIKLVTEAKAALTASHNLPTGLPTLDNQRCGPVIGRVTVVAARTSHGKTTMAINLATHLLRQGVRVVYYTLETSRQVLVNRMVCQMTGLALDELANANGHAAAVETAYRSIEKWPLEVLDRKDQIHSVMAAVRARHRRNPVGMLVVDFMQRYGTSPADLDPVFDQLVRFATNENVAVLALSQITKQYDSKGRIDQGRPLLASMKGSTTLAEQAGMVWILWRPERDGHETIPVNVMGIPSQQSTKGRIEIVVAKNSDGPTAAILGHFNERCFQIME